MRGLLDRILSAKSARVSDPQEQNRHAALGLRALERASRAMRAGGTPLELFEVAGGVFGDLGFATAVMLFTSEREELELTYLSNPPGLVRQAEALIGVRQDQFTVRPDQTQFHQEVLGERRTVFWEDTSDVMAEILPRVPQRVLRAVASLLGFRSIIGAPLRAGDELLGMIIVSARDLRAEDAQVARLVAVQLGAMLHTSKLREQLEASVVDLEATQTQLLESQKRETIGLLAGGVAHDFNNLLSAITLSAEMLSSAVEDPATKADVEIIRESCERGSSLVAQLLALGRRTELRIAPFDVDEMLRELERLLDRVLGEDVEIAICHGDGTKLVAGDRSQIEQVLLNLALNARDAMPEGGSLTLSTCGVAGEPGGQVELVIRDDGVGMEAATLERAFEPFFTTKGRARGSGLGLSVVRSIVEQHGGDIRVESAVGAGTAFRVRLPTTSEAPAVATEPPAPRAHSRGDGRVVLIVEDDSLVRRMCSRVLRRAGWAVHPVGSAAGARRAVSELGDTIVLIFCDVVLPDGRGPRLLDELCQTIPAAGVIVTSGYVGERADRHLIEERGWAFLPKPYRHAALLSMVDEVLAGS